MSNTNEAAIIAKIKRMLDMAKDPRTNESEAQVAQDMAHKLMMRYNIEAAALNNQNNSDRLKNVLEYPALFEWQRNLMKGLADVYFCYHSVDKAHWGKTSEFRHTLIGRKVNITLCLNMYKYLYGAMDRLMPFKGQDRLRKAGLSWRVGFIDSVLQRLRDKSTEERNEHRRKMDEERARNSANSDGSSLIIYYEDLYEMEECANLDVLYGLQPGSTYARRQETKRKHAERVEKMKNAPPRETVKETEEERRAREKREKKWHERWEREQRKQAEKYDYNAMRSGYSDGQTISLDKQVSRRAEADPAPANAPKLGA